jgi:hypothetical protein
MRFSTILISALAAVATAAPNSLEVRGQDDVADAIVFAVQAHSCPVLKCAKVVAAAVCIGLAIESGAESKILKCVEGGAHAVCCGLERIVDMTLTKSRFAHARSAFPSSMTSWSSTMFARRRL